MSSRWNGFIATTLAPLELWVDATAGADGNPGTMAAPLATLVEAERRIPHVVAHPVTVHVGPHVGAGYVPPTFRPRHLQCSIDIIADSGGTNDDGFVELVAPRAALAGTSHTVCKTSGLAADAIRGKTIEVLSGLASQHRRTIKLNTDVNIVPCLLWPGSTIATGDMFRIVEPAVAIDVDQAPDSHWTVTQGAPDVVIYGFHSDSREVPSVNFVNMKFVGSATLMGGPQVRFFGCEFPGPFALFLGGAFAHGVDRIDTSVFREVSEVAARHGSNDIAWVGWGSYVVGAAASVRASSHWLYGLVASQLYVYGGHLDMRGGNVYSGGVHVYSTGDNSPADVELDGKVYLPDILMVFTNTGGPAVEAAGHGASVTVDESQLVGSTLGVFATDGAVVALGAAGGAVSVSGAVGLKANLGGRVMFKATSVSATGNEIEVGNTPTVSTVAALGVAGAYVAEADGSVVQRLA